MHSSTRFRVSIVKPLLVSLRHRRSLSRTSEPGLLGGRQSDEVSAIGSADVRPLFCKCVDIGRDVLRLPARQRHVHPGMRIHDRKRQRVRVGGIFSRDRFERRGIGHDSTLARRDDVAGGATRFSKTFAVIGVGGKRARCSEHRGKQRTKAKQLHENLPQQFELILLLEHVPPD